LDMANPKPDWAMEVCGRGKIMLVVWSTITHPKYVPAIRQMQLAPVSASVAEPENTCAWGV